MVVIQVEGDGVTIRISKSELVILSNALNETREAIEDWEFETRVGASTVEAEGLRAELNAVLSQMN